MKKQITYAVIALLVLMNACQKSDTMHDSDNQGDKGHSVALSIYNDGFDTTGMYEWGPYYVVEGDILIPKSNIGATKPRQAINSYSDLINVPNQQNITIRIDASVASDGGRLDWRNEVSQAIAEYNSLSNNSVRFTLVSSSTADITVRVGAHDPVYNQTLGAGTIAAAGMPTNGKPFHTVVLNQNYYTTPTSGQKKYNLVHELGHCIGFRHTNWYGVNVNGYYYERGQPAIGVPGSPTSGNNPDPLSVFNGQTADHSWNGFSSWDRYSISYLYPVTLFETATSSPFAVSKDPQTLDVFVKGANSNLLHKWYSTTENWSEWSDLGGNITSEPVAICKDSYTIDVFARGPSNNLLHKWYSTSTGWSNWIDRGGYITSTPVAVSRNSSTIDVFAKGANNNLVHLWYSISSGWSSWIDRGGNIASGPAAISKDAYTIDVFARAPNNNLMHIWHHTSSGWSTWINRGGNIISDPSIVSKDPHTIDVFALGTNNNLMHMWYSTSSPGSGWSNWIDRGGNINSKPVSVSKDQYTIDVFASNANSNLMHMWYSTSSPGSGWSAWTNKGGNVISMCAVSKDAQTWDVFGLTTGNGLMQQWYHTSTGWSSQRDF